MLGQPSLVSARPLLIQSFTLGCSHQLNIEQSLRKGSQSFTKWVPFPVKDWWGLFWLSWVYLYGNVCISVRH